MAASRPRSRFPAIGRLGGGGPGKGTSQTGRESPAPPSDRVLHRGARPGPSALPNSARGDPCRTWGPGRGAAPPCGPAYRNWDGASTPAPVSRPRSSPPPRQPRRRLPAPLRAPSSFPLLSPRFLDRHAAVQVEAATGSEDVQRAVADRQDRPRLALDVAGGDCPSARMSERALLMQAFAAPSSRVRLAHGESPYPLTPTRRCTSCAAFSDDMQNKSMISVHILM